MRSETIINKLENGRAEFAYRCVKKAKEKLGKGGQSDYRSYSRKIPTMVLTNGLGQTLAFIKSKIEKENAYELIYCDLTDYMKSNLTTRIQMPPDRDDLTEWVISCDSATYRYITQEILAFLSWLKRFAEGMIKEREEGEG